MIEWMKEIIILVGKMNGGKQQGILIISASMEQFGHLFWQKKR